MFWKVVVPCSAQFIGYGFYSWRNSSSPGVCDVSMGWMGNCAMVAHPVFVCVCAACVSWSTTRLDDQTDGRSVGLYLCSNDVYMCTVFFHELQYTHPHMHLRISVLFVWCTRWRNGDDDVHMVNRCIAVCARVRFAAFALSNKWSSMMLHLLTDNIYEYIECSTSTNAFWCESVACLSVYVGWMRLFVWYRISDQTLCAH